MKHLLLLCALFSSLSAMPAQVLIIRHGEKPPEGNHLDQKGRERAAALVPYFLGRPEVLEFGPPAALWAMNPGKETGSLRPRETLTQLAEALKLPLQTSYTRDDFQPMVKDIMENPAMEGKSVLICWEHHVIPEMAEAFGIKPRPPRWHGDDFDHTYVLQFKEGDARLNIIPQKLMFGDSH